MTHFARSCAFSWFGPLAPACGAFVAQLVKKRHNVTPSLHRTCHSNHAKPRHLPLCSNTHHSIHYLSPYSTPRAPFCSELPPNAPVCTLRSPTVLRCPHLHPPRLRPKFLFARISCTCYMYTPLMPMSTPNRYRHGLEKLTGEPPATKTALISILLPEIETALASGKTRRQIWQRLVEDGI